MVSPLFIYFGRICELKFWILKCCADGKILWYSFLKIKLVLRYVPARLSSFSYAGKTFSDCNRKKISEIKGRGRKFALF